MIETRRLLLLPASVATLRAELESPALLAEVAQMDVPAEWPPELYDRDAIEWMLRRLEAAPDEPGWWVHYFVLKRTRQRGLAVGCGGYKGPPQGGTLEIGYSIVTEYRRQGFAFEAAQGLIEHAFARPDVERVIAETLPQLAPSIGVLDKCGFVLLGAGSEEGVIRYELRRDRWQRRHALLESN